MTLAMIFFIDGIALNFLLGGKVGIPRMWMQFWLEV
jgi:hypothetical protein